LIGHAERSAMGVLPLMTKDSPSVTARVVPICAPRWLGGAGFSVPVADDP
jgi:hypothetical protein